MNQPLLHVMIPAYGESPHLEETLTSACENLSDSVLITVLEDTSEANVIESITSKFKPRVNYQRNSKRLGIANNFNKCLEQSQGKFTQICGHDDLIIKDPTNMLKKTIDKSQEQLNLIFSTKVIQESISMPLRLADLAKRVLTPRKNTLQEMNNKVFLERLMLGYWFHFPAIIWRTEAAKKYKFNDQLKSAMDLDFLIDMIINNEKFKFIDEEILAYRRHTKSASSVNSVTGNRFYEEIRCHEKVSLYAKRNKYRKLNYLSKLALGVRANAIINRAALRLKP
jgi:glycosyltransferase involved in cell wall biosynthesis